MRKNFRTTKEIRRKEELQLRLGTKQALCVLQSTPCFTALLPHQNQCLETALVPANTFLRLLLEQVCQSLLMVVHVQSDLNTALEHPSMNKGTFLPQLLCLETDIRYKFILMRNRIVKSLASAIKPICYTRYFYHPYHK